MTVYARWSKIFIKHYAYYTGKEVESVDPAAERVLTVDKRAREEVRKAEKYAEELRASRASSEADTTAEAEAEYARVTEKAVAEAEAEADAGIEAVRREAEKKIAALRAFAGREGDAISARIVREITEIGK